MTIAQALDVRDRSISSRDAEIFLQDILKVERAWLHAHLEEALTPLQEHQFTDYAQRREENQPVAYIIGQREFYGRPFKCDKRALIPRPETEGLIDRALNWLPPYFQEKLHQSNKPCPLQILELGTGSGNIAISLALELQKRSVPVSILATDISAEALSLASENWHNLQEPGLAKITFIEADLFQHPLIQKTSPFDLIVANLPYVPTTWQLDPAAQAEVVFQEPDIALFGGEDGLAIYRQFFQQVCSYLKPTGKILIEFGEDETAAIQVLAKQAFPAATISIHQDYAQLDRLLEISLPSIY